MHISDTLHNRYKPVRLYFRRCFITLIKSTQVPRKTSFMKTMFFIIISVCLANLPVAAQHPLVGTWEMISVKGVDADGEPFYFDTSAVRETKIITPTHYILIAWDVGEDSLIFNRTMAGQVRLEGEKYIEIPTQASVQIFENVQVDFTWKLAGDIFTQSGTIVRPDGKRILLEALIFERVTNVKPQKNPAIGTWNQLSANYTTADGKSNSTFNDSDTRLLIVTPTHWMRMDHKNKKFDGVLYGTYTLDDGDTIITKVDFSSYPFNKGEHSKFTQKVKGNQIHIKSAGKAPDGKPATFDNIFEKAQ